MNGYMERIYDTYKSVGDLLEKGLADQGLHLIKRVSPDIRDHVIVRYLKGVCQQESGSFEMAEYYFRGVIQDDPGFIAAAEALLYMSDNTLTDGEKAYLCELIAMMKPESGSLKDIRKNLGGASPEPLAIREKPEEITEILHPKVASEITEPKEKPVKEETLHPASGKSSILQKIQEKKNTGVSQKMDHEPEQKSAEEKTSYLGDILVDLKKKESPRNSIKHAVEDHPEEEDISGSIMDIHLSPEEEAEIEREERLEESELLADSEEATKLKDLLKTLHERKHRDIEEDKSAVQAETQNEAEEENTGPFDTLTMARVYYKQGACSSALRILSLLKKNTSNDNKLKEIESLTTMVREKIEAEKME